MANVFDYIFRIGGDFTAQISGMSAAAGEFTAQVEGAQNRLGQFTMHLAGIDLVKDSLEGLHKATDELSGAGIRLDSQMHDLSAVAGVAGDSLKEIEGFARESAVAFGTDAGEAVEGYKLLLSQLTPELGKYPDALREMGDCIQTTSKLMGGDGVAAAQVLTTAMNQYGVSLEDPMAASGEMARMMNVMAAAGQAGSAELPAISAALQQCGMAAKAANVSFEETNAAIQVLDKAGKKASEGGVALRNVLGQLSKGRFVEKQAREELEKAGIDVVALGDNSKSLKERLEMLKPMLNDSALLSKFFGVENANAARALIQGTESLQDFTDAVTGTNSATDQAAIVMDSYAERQARVNQKIEDFKISMFQATGDLTLWAGAIFNVLTPLSQMMPLLMGVGSLMKWIKGLKWASMWRGIRGVIYATRNQMAFMNKELITGQITSNGFMINMVRATLAVARFATVGLFNALKGLGALILSMVTGGSASVTFSGVASGAFATFATVAKTACTAISTAIYSIPIIGWVALAITAIASVGAYFWETSAKFRASLKGTWAEFKAFFTELEKYAIEVFGGIGDLISAAFQGDSEGISKAIDRMKNAETGYANALVGAYKKAYDEEMEKARQEAEAEKNGATENFGSEYEEQLAKLQEQLDESLKNMPQIPDIPEVPPVNLLGSTLPSAKDSSGRGSGEKIKNITITIDKLIERFEIHSATVGESAEKIKSVVVETLMGALNDTQLAV